MATPGGPFENLNPLSEVLGEQSQNQGVANTPNFQIPQQNLVLGTEGVGQNVFTPNQQQQVPIQPTVPSRRVDIPQSNVSAIDAAITQESIQRTGMTPEEQRLAQEQADIQAQVDASGQVIRPGDLGARTNFPTLGQPIGVGQQSGQIFGSETVFAAPGAVFPIGMVQARQKAIDEAAQRQAAKQTAFERPKSPLVKDKRFQKSLDTAFNDSFNQFVSEAKRDFGANWRVALQDTSTGVGRKFTESMQALNTLAAEGDQIADRVAKVQEGLESGDLVVSSKTKQLLEDYKTLQGELAEGDVNKLAEFGRNLDNIQAGVSIAEFFNEKDVLGDIKGQISTSLGKEWDGEFLTLNETEVTSFKNQIPQIAKNLAEGGLAGSPVTQKQIEDHLTAMLGTQIKKSQTAKARPKVKGGGSRRPEDIHNRERDLDDLANVFFDPQGNLVADPNIAGAELLGIFQGGKAGKGNVLGAQVVKGGENFVDANGNEISVDDDSIMLQIEEDGRPGQQMKGKDGYFVLSLSDPDFRDKANTVINSSPSNANVLNDVLYQDRDPRSITPRNIRTASKEQVFGILTGQSANSRQVRNEQTGQMENAPSSFNELENEFNKQGLQLKLSDQKVFEDEIAAVQNWANDPKQANSIAKSFIGSVDDTGSKLIDYNFKEGKRGGHDLLTLTFKNAKGKDEFETFDLTQEDVFSQLDELFKSMRLPASVMENMIK